MDLVIFDIDGTLIHSYQKEADCYEEALKNVMGISHIDKDLSLYQHVSDHGIANEIIMRACQRPATDDEQFAIENEFIRLFKESLAKTPLTRIPGVQALLSHLTQEPTIALAIATGCYHRSALLKFEHAELPLKHLPIGSSNDSPIRTNIMQAAHAKAKSAYGIEQFDSITYIGDGPWDVRAVKELQWDFIGIASNYSHDTLTQLGAQNVVQDYSCLKTFCDYLFTG